MKRRDFLKGSGSGLAAFSAARILPGIRLFPQIDAEQAGQRAPIINWADKALGAAATASSFYADPPWGYGPENVFGGNLHLGWQASAELAGAWIEIRFPEPRKVAEIWLLANPLPADVLGQDVYMMTYSRTALRAAPRRIRVTLSSGTTSTFTALEESYYQILALPQQEETSIVRISVEEVWPRTGASEVSIGKIRVFSESHPRGFAVTAHSMYDVQNGQPVQAATLQLINPGEAAQKLELRCSLSGKLVMTVPLQPIPGRASCEQSVWIPAPFEDSQFDFQLISPTAEFCCKQTLQVPRYRSYFDDGTYELVCTNHNDLGWLNTQEKTADYRSSALILPALELMRSYPEFAYSMESTAYLMEFLERHPEKRDEMAAMMRQKRFTWGASYVQLLQVSAGPEKLVRQFYFGRRWLKKTFPGVDTRFYVQTDPPVMSLQMPQILAKAGIRYCLLGRLPFGFYKWQSPDGSSVVTRGFRYVDPETLLNPKDHSGWLHFAEERTDYYAAHDLPRDFVYDYVSDYLPPQPDIVPYVRRENARMQEFAKVWNAHFAGDRARAIHPPRIQFTTPEQFLDQFTAQPLNLTTLCGEWPHAWAYYDEPSNREALLKGRLAHNGLLAAERLYAGLGARHGFADYPARDFEQAWRLNIWPDHGWGGNRGTLTDQVYADSYAKSKACSDAILSKLAQRLTPHLPRTSGAQIPLAVYNPLSWPRTDLVECSISMPEHWPGWELVDGDGKAVPCEFVATKGATGAMHVSFLARDVPAVGYRCFYLRRADTQPPAPVSLQGDTLENSFFRLTFGHGGIKSLFDKRHQWEVLRTDKFEGGEILQFTAPGNAWEDPERVGMPDFDRTANHDFPIASIRKSPLRTTVVREAYFSNFALRQRFHLYDELDRIDIDVEILKWDGAKSRELRVAFPLNLDEARLSYEVPFGTVEMGKDELDVSLLPSRADSQFFPENYGGDHALAFREAINWIDASSPNFARAGCLAASDSTVHIFRDETDTPVSYPVLQHVLLSDRKSLAWNPEYWYSQEGDHRYRMALLPHGGSWRLRYRDAIGFNYRLIAFVGPAGAEGGAASESQSFLDLYPRNLVLTAMKKSEDDDRIVVRFYEAEGNATVAHIKLDAPIRRAWKASLIEEDEEPIEPLADGTVRCAVGSWEIVTLKFAV
jgi:alpha-mannosidase